MEEKDMNTDIREQATQPETMGNESEVQGTGEEKGQKTFTQEEVNNFVQSRISRIKAQAAREAQAEYTKKLAELEAREMKLLVKEQLSERGMPSELAGIITCTDEKDLSSKLDTLQKIYGGKAREKEKSAGFVQIAGARPYEGSRSPSGGLDPVRRAMGLE